LASDPAGMPITSFWSLIVVSCGEKVSRNDAQLDTRTALVWAVTIRIPQGP
jgi:hypothetical protein